MTEIYQQPERRMTKSIEQLEANLREMLDASEKRERAWITDLIDKLKNEAFPDGNLTGHHDYHEGRRRAAKAEEEFWRTAKSEALKHGISGLFAVGKWVLILSLLGLAYKLGCGPIATKILGVS